MVWYGIVLYLIISYGTIWYLYGTVCQVSQKLYLILKLNFTVVKSSITKMFVLPDSRDRYKSFVA